jgi:hypothetical protein
MAGPGNGDPAIPARARSHGPASSHTRDDKETDEVPFAADYPLPDIAWTI